jgi:hypothetical protein
MGNNDWVERIDAYNAAAHAWQVFKDGVRV